MEKNKKENSTVVGLTVMMALTAIVACIVFLACRLV